MVTLSTTIMIFKQNRLAPKPLLYPSASVPPVILVLKRFSIGVSRSQNQTGSDDLGSYGNVWLYLVSAGDYLEFHFRYVSGILNRWSKSNIIDP